MKKESNSRKASKFLQEGIRLDGLKEYQKAIEAYDIAMNLNPAKYDEIYYETLREAEAEELMMQDLEEHLAQGRILN